MARITVQEAKITTVQIEIQALKVGAKQVTMGLFRQLPLKPLVEPETFNLCGMPWGWVNYFWEGSGGSQAESDLDRVRHIVWQYGNVLYRALCYQDVRPMLRGIPQKELAAIREQRWTTKKDSQTLWKEEEVYCAPWQKRWAPQWHALMQLSQLFIAV